MRLRRSAAALGLGLLAAICAGPPAAAVYLIGRVWAVPLEATAFGGTPIRSEDSVRVIRR
jgi:hypothetical protein